MEPLGPITALVPLAASTGSFLVSPGVGLMIWTLVLFVFTMWVLSKVAFPRIQEALDKRANAIRDSIEQAEKDRQPTAHEQKQQMPGEDVGEQSHGERDQPHEL